jgi:hypothetical protein
MSSRFLLLSGCSIMIPLLAWTPHLTSLSLSFPTCKRLLSSAWPSTGHFKASLRNWMGKSFTDRKLWPIGKIYCCECKCEVQRPSEGCARAQEVPSISPSQADGLPQGPNVWWPDGGGAVLSFNDDFPFILVVHSPCRALVSG